MKSVKYDVQNNPNMCVLVEITSFPSPIKENPPKYAHKLLTETQQKSKTSLQYCVILHWKETNYLLWFFNTHDTSGNSWEGR